MVVGLYANGPHDEETWWGQIIKRATRAVARLYRNGDFSYITEGPQFMRVGAEFGVRGPVSPCSVLPKRIINLRPFTAASPSSKSDG